MRVVIIGGGSAGTTCAFELRKLDKDAEITILEKTQNTEYSPCALPYVISGEINEFNDIFIFKKEDYERNNIRLYLNSEVERIDKEHKTVTYSRGQEKERIHYDKLVLATGSSPFIAPIEGLEDTDYHVFKTIEDAQGIAKDKSEQRTSAVIGAGMIGVELAHSLAGRGENVKLIEVQENILPGMLDKKMSTKLKEHLGHIQVYEGEKVERIRGNELVVGGTAIAFDKLFLCTGIEPNITLARETGLQTDKGIVVNEFLQTYHQDIYACGDCVESIEHNTGERFVSGLGTTAVRQAGVIAKHIVGKEERFLPPMNNSITKLGGVYVGSVGLTEKRAKASGIRSVAAEYTGHVRAEYYDAKSKITSKLIVDDSGTVIGGQIVGDAEVAGRLNLLALAISKEMHVNELAGLETCYNPASAPIFDPLSVTAQICEKKRQVMRGK